MVKIKRARIGTVSGIDITVKSAKGVARRFAPTWEMVYSYKAWHSEKAYTKAYQERLGKVPASAWAWLASFGEEVTVLCYCQDYDSMGHRAFCHTHLLIDFAIAHFPGIFSDGRSPDELPCV